MTSLTEPALNSHRDQRPFRTRPGVTFGAVVALHAVAAGLLPTRRFVAPRKDPVSVGFAFSLGHSPVVILAGVLAAEHLRHRLPFGLEDPVTTWLGERDLGEAGLLLAASLLTAWGVASFRGRLLTSRRAASRPGARGRGRKVEPCARTSALTNFPPGTSTAC